MRDFRTEFPDYDGPLPDIAHLGFNDVSWHNDACPTMSKVIDGRTATVYCDYINSELREFDGHERFTVVLNGEAICKTDSENELIEFLSSRLA